MKLRNHHAGCCGHSPTRPDGSEWSHVMAFHDGSMVHADTPAEVMDELLPGYERLDETGRSDARRRHACRLAERVQEARIAQAVSEGLLDEADPDAAGLLAVLRADKRESILLETEDAPGAQADWLGSPSLVLVATSYAPTGAHPPIGGNVKY